MYAHAQMLPRQNLDGTGPECCRVLSLQEVAQLTGRDRHAIVRAVKAGLLRGTSLWGSWAFLECDFVAHFSEHRKHVPMIREWTDLAALKELKSYRFRR